MSVHAMFIKSMASMPASGPATHEPVGQVPFLPTAVSVDITIGGAEVQIPADAVAMLIHETEGTAFRYATGETGVTVPDAPNAHRWTSYMGALAVGVRGGDFLKTAAA